MAVIEGACADVLAVTEVVMIATVGEDGRPHLVATWGDYVRALGIRNGDTLLVPVGMMRQTERNLSRNARVDLLCGARQVAGSHGPGQGCHLAGTGRIETSGEWADAVRAQFAWARAALVIRVETTQLQL